MSYTSICKVVYDYTAQAEDELTLTEDAYVYILDASDPEWWKAKHRPPISADGQPQGAQLDGKVGLVPANYVEEAEPLRMSRALYDYTAANDDELSVQEDELLRVYEYEGQWLLVKRQGADELGTGEGKLGFVPANYVDEVQAVDAGPTQVDTTQAQAEQDEQDDDDEADASGVLATAPPMPTISVKSAATDRADDISMWAVSALDAKKKKKKGTLGIGNASLFFASESDKTPVQKISVLDLVSHAVEKGKTLHVKLDDDVETQLAVDDETRCISFVAATKGDAEAIAKKLDTSKDIARDAARNPPKAAPAAGAGAAAGAPRAVPPPAAAATNGSAPRVGPAAPTAPAPPAASSSTLPPPVRKVGGSTPSPAPVATSAAPALAAGEEHAIALYDFEAQGDDELSVAENEPLVIVERENDDWWKVRNASGAEGVVPASYVEATEAPADAADAAAAAAAAAADGPDEDELELERQRNEEEMAAIQAAEAERQKAARAAEMERRKRELVDKRRREEAEDRRRRALKAAPAPAVPTVQGRSTVDRDARTADDVKIPSGRSAPERPKDSGRSSECRPD